MISCWPSLQPFNNTHFVLRTLLTSLQSFLNLLQDQFRSLSTRFQTSESNRKAFVQLESTNPFTKPVSDPRHPNFSYNSTSIQNENHPTFQKASFSFQLVAPPRIYYIVYIHVLPPERSHTAATPPPPGTDQRRWSVSRRSRKTQQKPTRRAWL